MTALATALALVSTACGTTARSSVDPVATKPTPTAFAPDIEQIRRGYDHGWERIVVALSLVPLQASPEAEYTRLQQLKTFREEHVRWATLRENEFYALEQGHSRSAWLVIVPIAHPVTKQMVSALQIHAGPEPLALLIKPEPITELWAGIFLVHELSHLEDYARGVESSKSSRQEFLLGELRAYGVEVTAGSLLAQGDLERKLDLLLQKWRPSTVTDIPDRVRKISGADLATLESALLSLPAASETEMRLRGGFYTMALVLRYARQHRLGMDSVLMVLDSLHPYGSPAR